MRNSLLLAVVVCAAFCPSAASAKSPFGILDHLTVRNLETGMQDGDATRSYYRLPVIKHLGIGPIRLYGKRTRSRLNPQVTIGYYLTDQVSLEAHVVTPRRDEYVKGKRSYVAGGLAVHF